MEPLNPTNYLQLPEETHKRIQATAELVGDVSDELERIRHISDLNTHLVETGLLGQTVRITSEALSIVGFRMSDDGVILEPVLDETLLALTSVEGKLGPIDLFSDPDGYMTLAYKVELPSGEEEAVFYTAMAPVEEAVIVRRAVDALPVPTRDDRELAACFGIMARISEVGYLSDLKEFMMAVEELDIEDDASLRAVGRFGSWLMAHDEAKNNDEIHNAIVRAIELVTISRSVFSYDGHELIKSWTEDGENISFRSVASEGRVARVVLVEDYEIDGTGGESLFEETYQPAFEMWDSIECVHRVIPIKHIRSFVDITPESTGLQGMNIDCTDSNTMFRSQHIYGMEQ